MAWLLDLDGVVWLAHNPIQGAAEAIKRLQQAGETVLFVTNFSALTEAEIEAKLAAIGVDASGSVISSAMAAGNLISAGERVLVCAGPGVTEAVTRAGGVIVSARAAGQEKMVPGDTVAASAIGGITVSDVTARSVEVDAVVVGFHPDFDFEELTVGARALHNGARLIATNSDPTYPTPDGLIPGNGALVAAFAVAGKVDAIVAGKPHLPIAELIHSRLGTTSGAAGNRDRHVVVGDLPATDGLLARRLGFEFALVLSGVTDSEGAATCEPSPDVVAADLASLVSQRLG